GEAVSPQFLQEFDPLVVPGHALVLPLLRYRRDGEYARSPANKAGAGKRVRSAKRGANASQTGRQATQLEREGLTQTTWATMRRYASGTTATRPHRINTRSAVGQRGQITMGLTAASSTASAKRSDEGETVVRSPQDSIQLVNSVDDGLRAARISGLAARALLEGIAGAAHGAYRVGVGAADQRLPQA